MNILDERNSLQRIADALEGEHATPDTSLSEKPVLERIAIALEGQLDSTAQSAVAYLEEKGYLERMADAVDAGAGQGGGGGGDKYEEVLLWTNPNPRTSISTPFKVTPPEDVDVSDILYLKYVFNSNQFPPIISEQPCVGGTVTTTSGTAYGYFYSNVSTLKSNGFFYIQSYPITLNFFNQGIITKIYGIRKVN